MEKRYYSATALAAACLMAVCSCVKEQLPTGGFGRRSIVPVVSTADVQTKSDAPESNHGRCIATYPVEVFGKDTLRLFVYEYDNDDLPSGMTEGAEPQTKGEVVTSTSINAEGQQFRMDAWLESANRYDGSQDGDGRVYITADKDNWHIMDGVTVERGTSGWGYTNGQEYPWRNQVKTNFWSVYPVSVSGRTVTYPGTRATDAEQAKLSFSYTLPSPCTASPFRDAENQPDLCFAYNTKTWEDGNDNKVNIKFHHALAAVYFSVDDVISSISVDQIGLDNVYSKGDCDVTGSSGNTPSFTWKNWDVLDDFTQDYASSTDFTASGRTQQFESNDKIYMQIPQTLNDGTKLRARFKMSDGTYQTKTVEISKHSNGTSVEWKPGKKYLYRLGFNGYVYTFELVTASDSQVSFSNTTNPSTYPVGIKSFKTADNGTQTEVDWKIKSVRIGSGTTETIAAGSFTDKDGLSAQAQLSSKQLSLTSLARTPVWKGSNDWWTNKDGVSGDTDGSGRSPKSWGSDGLNKGVIDLSKYNPYTDTPDAHDMTTANCYIIRHAGTYKLPLVYGNAICNGYVDNQSFAPTMAAGGSEENFLSPFVSHLDTPIASPYIENNGNVASCSVVWQDEAEVIKSLQYVPGSPCGYLQFEISQADICQNNAIIAVKDGNNKTMWSWHIWTTNDPALLSGAVPVNNYAGNSYNFFPLNNLGWIDPTDYPEMDDVRIVMEQQESGKEIEIVVRRAAVFGVSSGCYYQFGRKDPMCRVDSPGRGLFTRNGRGSVPANNGRATIGEAISNPGTLFLEGTDATAINYHSWCPSLYYNLWTGKLCSLGVREQDNSMIKTIYDPSPVGYKVPASNAYTGFSTTGTNTTTSSQFNISGSFDKGWKFYTRPNKQGDLIFYSAAGCRVSTDGSLSNVGYSGNYWSANPAVPSIAGEIYTDLVNTFSFFSGRVYPTNPNIPSHSFSVRPVTYEPDLNDLEVGPHFNDYDDKGDKDITF